MKRIGALILSIMLAVSPMMVSAEETATGTTTGAAVTVVAPQLSVESGTYDKTFSARLKNKSDYKTGTKFYYTVDESTPGPDSDSSKKMLSSVMVKQTETLKVVAVYRDTTSEVATYNYKITPKAPKVSPSVRSSYTKAVNVKFSMLGQKRGTEFHYTLDGTEPTEDSEAWDGEAIVIDQTTTLKAIAVYNDEKSTVATFQYNFATSGASDGGTTTPADGTTTGGTTTGGTTPADGTTTGGTTPADGTTTGSTTPADGTTTGSTTPADGTTTGSTTPADGTTAPVTATLTAPIVSPAEGSYNSVQKVSINIAGTSSTVKAYYTVDGSEPTKSSTLYNGSPITVDKSVTLKVKLFDGEAFSDTASFNYTINLMTLKTPQVTLKTGTYSKVQTVKFSNMTDYSGTTGIYYTLDGTQPTSSSTMWNGNDIAINKTLTLKAMAVNGANYSDVFVANYEIELNDPVVTPGAGTFVGAMKVTLKNKSDYSTSAKFYYTLDGKSADPAVNTAAKTWDGATAIAITNPSTLTICVVDGANKVSKSFAYTIALSKVTVTPDAGSYTSVQKVTINIPGTSSTVLAYYTVDGSEPTTASSLYRGEPITVSKSLTLKIKTFDGSKASATASFAYKINLQTLKTPQVSLKAGTYSKVQYVKFSNMADYATGTAIYYTLDGKEPTKDSTMWNGNEITINKTETLKAIAIKGSNYSAVMTAAYKISLKDPVVTPGAGKYVGTQKVTLKNKSDYSTSAKFYYTLDGKSADPSVNTAAKAWDGTTAISISSSVTLTVCVVDGANKVSKSFAYTIALGKVTVSPDAGSYTSVQKVTINIPGSSSAVKAYYTLDGKEPTTSSTLYTGVAITVSKSLTLKIKTYDGSKASDTASFAYKINLETLKTPQVSLKAGTYSKTQYVKFSNTTSYPSGTKFYYTLDGKEPTTSSTMWNGNDIAINKSLTLNAIAYSGSNHSAVMTVAYKIVLNSPVVTPGAGKYVGTQKVTLKNKADYSNGAKFYYTLDGKSADPTANSAAKAWDGTTAISVSNSATLNVEVVDGSNKTSKSFAYTIALAEPTVNVKPGTYKTAQKVSISIPGASSTVKAYYTIDGKEPTTSSKLYTGTPITVDKTLTLKVKLFDGSRTSDTASFAYTIHK